MVGTVIGMATAIACFAAAPWLLVQVVARYNPKLKTRRAKRNYRTATAVVAVAVTVPIYAGIPWLYMLTTIAATALAVRWSTYPKRKANADALAAQGWLKVERGDNNT